MKSCLKSGVLKSTCYTLIKLQRQNKGNIYDREENAISEDK